MTHRLERGEEGSYELTPDGVMTMVEFAKGDDSLVNDRAMPMGSLLILAALFCAAMGVDPDVSDLAAPRANEDVSSMPAAEMPEMVEKLRNVLRGRLSAVSLLDAI